MAKILVVEDEFLIRLLIVETLENDGYTVLEAPDGETALAIVGATPDLDLIVTDVRMPKTDGFALARSSRALRPKLGLLFVTGYLGTDVPAEFAADRFLQKPFDPDTLAAVVREMLEKQAAAPG
ncbi:MAG TPA: response regulator [Rhizomicrobium sp.]